VDRGESTRFWRPRAVSARATYRIAEGRARPYHVVRQSHPEEHAMAAATRKNQERIIANEKRILRNQRRLLRILDNEKRILQNLQAMLKNQKKILANQSRILAR
jgi:hypothetical protein